MTPILVRDLLMNMLLGLTALVVLVLAQINPVAKPTENIHPAGQIAVSVCWKKGPLDIDTWALAPGEPKPVGYQNRSGKVWSLLRDNLGESGGTSPANCESMFARETPAGEYVINVFGFSVSEVTDVHVEIGVGKDADSMHVYTYDVAVANRQERTVMRFSIDDKGEIVPSSISELFKPLFTAPQGTFK